MERGVPRFRTLAAAGLLLATLAACGAFGIFGKGEAEDLKRTWARAVVRVHADSLGTISGRRDDPEIQQKLEQIPTGTTFPTVIYMHECGGLTKTAFAHTEFLMKAGFAVILPDAHARKRKLPRCESAGAAAAGPHVKKWYRMREKEIENAVEGARRLAWVDRQNMFLMGHGQGGTAAAAYSDDEFRARVISGSSCWRGIDAAAEVPILALSSKDDPWLKGYAKGSCAGRTATISIVLRGRAHDIVGASEGAIVQFLKENMKK